jgi:hypothetical protein
MTPRRQQHHKAMTVAKLTVERVGVAVEAAAAAADGSISLRAA